MNSQVLVVIGAGPKGLAIAAKNKVLTDLGFDTPRVVLIEKTGVASHWTGKSGYTNGHLELGTSPEKDIGFPYKTTKFSYEINQEINRRMKAFSWDYYLTECGKYSEYIDRGKPSPTHAQFAEYLAWVAFQLKDSVQIVIGEVHRISIASPTTWKIEYRTKLYEEKILSHGLVITGPGASYADFPVEGNKGVFDIESFWRKMPELPFKSGDRICLVGAGENSATIAAALSTLSQKMKIDIVSPSAFVFSRGESYLENRVFSHAELGQWNRLTDEDKLNFIRRTDLSVFGQYVQSLLNKRRDIEIVPGRVTKAVATDQNLLVTTLYNEVQEIRSYEYMVTATGFDHLHFLRSAMTEETQKVLLNQLGLQGFFQENLSKMIGKDMAIEGLKIKLHLPMLSRMKQGPGFANLSSLGKLSDQILYPYVKQAALARKESDSLKILEAVC